MEFIVYVSVALLFLVLGKLWFFGSNMSRTEQFIILLFIFLLITAQSIQDHNKTYPVANWAMYTSVNPAPHYYEFILETIDGDRFHYPFSAVTKISPRAFIRKIENVEQDYASSGSDEQHLKQERMEKTVESLLNIYSKKYPDERIKRLEVNAVVFDTDCFDEESLTRYTYYTYIVE